MDEALQTAIDSIPEDSPLRALDDARLRGLILAFGDILLSVSESETDINRREDF